MLRGVFEGLVADRKPLRLASFPRRFDACLQRGLQEGLGRERGKEVGRSRGRFSMLLATRIKRHTDGDFIGKRKSVAAWVLLDVRINCAPYGRAEVASPFRGGGFPLFSIESSRPRPVEKATREDARQTACLRSNLDINPLKRRRLLRFISHANGDPVRELKLSRGAGPGSALSSSLPNRSSSRLRASSFSRRHGQKIGKIDGSRFNYEIRGTRWLGRILKNTIEHAAAR